MAHQPLGGAGDAVARDEVRDGELGSGHAVFRVDDLADALEEGRERPLHVGAGQTQMASDHTLLGMHDAQLGTQGHDVAVFVDVHVAAGSIASSEQGLDRGVPSAKHVGAAGVGGIEVYAGLSTPDGRAGEGELELHRLGQVGDLLAGDAFPHTGATPGRAATEGVDDQPSPGVGLRVVPLHHLMRWRGEVVAVTGPNRGAHGPSIRPCAGMWVRWSKSGARFGAN